MIYKICIFSALFISVLTGYSYDSLKIVQRADSLFIIHEVESGETVYSLAKRYRITVENLIRQNGLKNNTLDIGQILEMNYKREIWKNSQIFSEPFDLYHEVVLGETLYSIAKKYNLSWESLKKMNLLTVNELSVGQHLIISDTFTTQDEKVSLISILSEEKKMDESPFDSVSMINIDPEVKSEFYVYYVQNGENLDEIATKFNTTTDQIKLYNNLKNYRVKTGQKIIFPDATLNDSTMIRISKVPNYVSTAYGSKQLVEEVGGVKKYIEEGLVLKLDSELNTPKYLALHRILSIGTIFEVVNLMNNKNAYVRVVGRLPNTGLNQNVMLRLTNSVFQGLGIVDQQVRMKMVYYK